MKKLKVVWVCHLSNQTLRDKLKFCRWAPVEICKRLFGQGTYSDFAAWNTNGIKEFEKFNDIELHIVAPHYGINGLQEFEKDGVFYHIFHSEDDNVISWFKTHILHKVRKHYDYNTKIIIGLIEQITPDIVHVIGAENPYYAESALSLPKDKTLIVSLQTLMCDPQFQKNYPIGKDAYAYRANVELQVIKCADYVATKSTYFKKVIREKYGDFPFLDLTIAIGENNINLESSDKQYDFVYFAVNISKAIDYAIEAFARAKRKHNEITLHVIGGYSEELMKSIKAQMIELGVTDGVDFTGKLPTYDDVIAEIRKCRYALLPLKIDLLTGTIRESMANGLPVISTITPETPKMNEKRQCLLLSEKGDFDAMAANMCRLLDEPELVEELRQYSAITLQEKYDNKGAMEAWRKAYFELIDTQD